MVHPKKQSGSVDEPLKNPIDPRQPGAGSAKLKRRDLPVEPQLPQVKPSICMARPSSAQARMTVITPSLKRNNASAAKLVIANAT